MDIVNHWRDVKRNLDVRTKYSVEKGNIDCQ